jgi:hypothetical protein
MMQSKKSENQGLTIKDLFDIRKDLFHSYQEIEAEVKSCKHRVQKEAEDIIAKAKSDGKLLLDEMNKDKRDWEKEKESIARTYHFKDNEIDLNVGGQHFTTTLTTLTRFPDTMIGAMFSGRHDLKKNHAGAFFIDRDGRHFHQILNFLRSPETYQLNMETDLKGEADFYGLGDLMFSVAPLTLAQPRFVKSEQGHNVIISQDIQGIWCVASPSQIMSVRKPLSYCQNCQFGWITNPTYNFISIKAFNTCSQPKGCVDTSCPMSLTCNI